MQMVKCSTQLCNTCGSSSRFQSYAPEIRHFNISGSIFKVNANNVHLSQQEIKLLCNPGNQSALINCLALDSGHEFQHASLNNTWQSHLL